MSHHRNRIRTVLRYGLIGGVLTLLLGAAITSSPLVKSWLADTIAYAATDCATQTDVPPAECAALLALYTATNGANWSQNTGWGQNNSICSWYGITCSGGSVQTLALSSNRVSGSIPPALGSLANLRYLDLARNQVSGRIPPELGSLANLQTVYLSGNQLNGSIPPELGSLTNLQTLYLSSNQVSGSIPPELGRLTNLRSLYLSGNQLNGSIPPELGTLANLTELYLSENQLSGSIPPELGTLANLRSLFLYGNQLSGSIPTALANLTNVITGELRLSNNELDTNVTDTPLLAWLDGRSGDNWRDQRGTATPTPTPMDTATATPEPTATSTVMATPTTTPTTNPTASPTLTSTAVSDPTLTPTPTVPVAGTATTSPTATPTATPQPTQPEVRVTTERGAPGSAFTFTGRGLPPNLPLTLLVNGTPLTPTQQLTTDGQGQVRFVLQTADQAQAGVYTVSVRGTPATALQAELVLTSRYTLEPSAPLLPPEAGSPLPISVPVSIPSTSISRLYLPLVVRGP